jgi:hypothetical protein
MKSDLAIAALIRSRMAELGLSRGEFVKRLGFKNIAKGIRRIDVLCDGDLEGTKHFLDVLPQALETSAETVKLALDQTVREIELAEKQEAEARDRIWRENFCPHAIIRADRAEPDFRGRDHRRRETPPREAWQVDFIPARRIRPAPLRAGHGT